MEVTVAVVVMVLVEVDAGGLLGVDQGHEQLHAGEGVGPGVAEGGGAVLGQVVLTEEAVEAQHPGVLDGLGEDPDVGGAPHVVGVVDQQGVPLHQPLEVHAVARRDRGLRGGEGNGSRASRSRVERAQASKMKS